MARSPGGSSHVRCSDRTHRNSQPSSLCFFGVHSCHEQAPPLGSANRRVYEGSSTSFLVSFPASFQNQTSALRQFQNAENYFTRIGLAAAEHRIRLSRITTFSGKLRCTPPEGVLTSVTYC